MQREYNEDYQRLYDTKLNQIDKNLDRFIKRKEQALAERIEKERGQKEKE